MKQLLILLAMSLTGAAQAYACTVYSSEVVAKVVSSQEEGGVCTMLVSIKETQPEAFCGLTLKKGQTIEVRAAQELLSEGCPQSKGYVLKGTVSTVGTGYILTEGTVSKK